MLLTCFTVFLLNNWMDNDTGVSEGGVKQRRFCEEGKKWFGSFFNGIEGGEVRIAHWVSPAIPMFDWSHLKGLDYGWMEVIGFSFCISLMCTCIFMTWDIAIVWLVAFERVGLWLDDMEWWFMAPIWPSTQFSPDSANIVRFQWNFSMQQWNSNFQHTFIDAFRNAQENIPSHRNMLSKRHLATKSVSI